MRAACLAIAAVAWPLAGCQGAAAPIVDPPLPGVAQPSLELGRRLETAPGAHDGAPETRHLRGDGTPAYTNRLALATSPYLRQHAHNPVNWYPWGDEAFARARREGKPVFLSIGYSTCHWCHVMARESFDDDLVAAYLNQHFVAIKVDREERPDVDAVYMEAALAMTGSGGWPMTVVVTPDGRPFFAGSYLPRDRLLAVLRAIDAAYRDRPGDVVAQARALTERLGAQAAAPTGGALPGPDVLAAATRAYAARFDARHGGFGDAPKFPEPSALALLLHLARRDGDPAVQAMVTGTLDALAVGGIHDAIGGGFHRYATDPAWDVPHFEKMLYDNAQLAALYTDAWQATGNDAYRAIAEDTLAFIDRELGDPAGGFRGAFDADSPGGEGAYYTWTADELRAAVGPDDAAIVIAYYGGGGTIDDRMILHAARDADAASRAVIARTRPTLAAVRARRPPPRRDDKVVTSWNGLAISAFARAGVAFDRPDDLARARRAAEFALTVLRGPDGRLRRWFIDGSAGGRGGLDDHAFLIQGLIDLFEATGEVRWLTAARALAGALDADFAADGGGYHATARDAEPLLVRTRPATDGAEPSGNAIAIRDLLRLAELSGDDALRARAEDALAGFAGAIARAPTSAPALVDAVALDRDDATEIVIAGGDDAAGAARLLDVVRRTFVPGRVLIAPIGRGRLDALAADVPLIAGKVARDGRATAYVCHHRRCDLPTANPAVLAAELSPGAPAP